MARPVKNTYISKLGKRDCRSCAKENMKRYKEKNHR